MSQFDYKLLQALETVVRTQSFEKAAELLFISQSAVSQRIKLLEENIGKPVLIRTQPLRLTTDGEYLVAHYNQVIQLEKNLDIFEQNSNTSLVTISIATNADSLATWLIPALKPAVINSSIELNLIVVGENLTIDKLKSGEAFGAISTQKHPIKGCSSDLIGQMNYILVCSPNFANRYFPNGITRSALKKAPALAFDHTDNMHVDFLKNKFDLNEGDYPLHAVRSSEAFVAMAQEGLGYSLIPDLQVANQLENKTLIRLMPDFSIQEPLYWHRWLLLKGTHKQLSESLLSTGQKYLKAT